MSDSPITRAICCRYTVAKDAQRPDLEAPFCETPQPRMCDGSVHVAHCAGQGPGNENQVIMPNH